MLIMSTPLEFKAKHVSSQTNDNFDSVSKKLGIDIQIGIGYMNPNHVPPYKLISSNNNNFPSLVGFVKGKVYR